MITIACIFLITLTCGMVALIVYLACHHKGTSTRKLTGNGALPTRLLPEVSCKKPAPPPPKKSCGNCSSCKCNTTKSSGPR